jgi:hypothetical protein
MTQEKLDDKGKKKGFFFVLFFKFDLNRKFQNFILMQTSGANPLICMLEVTFRTDVKYGDFIKHGN